MPSYSQVKRNVRNILTILNFHLLPFTLKRSSVEVCASLGYFTALDGYSFRSVRLIIKDIFRTTLITGASNL